MNSHPDSEDPLPLGTPQHRRGTVPAQLAQTPAMSVTEEQIEAPLGAPGVAAQDSRPAQPGTRVCEDLPPEDPALLGAKAVPYAWPLPAWLLDRGLGSAAFALLAVGALIVYAYTLSTLTQIAALPVRAQPIAYGVLAALLVEILIGVWRCVVRVLRLRRARRISLNALAAWRERAEARQQSREDAKAAVKEVRAFLEEFPATTDELHRRGLGDEEIHALQSHRARLLESVHQHGETKWLQLYRDDFQTSLLKAGDRLIARRARSVAFRVAASPLPLLDTLVVINGARRLIEDLCELHRLRPGARGLFLVTLWAVAQAALAGKIEAMTETHLESQAEQWLHADWDVIAGSQAVEALGKSIGEYALQGAGQGLAQFLLLRRLGGLIQQSLRLVD